MADRLSLESYLDLLYNTNGLYGWIYNTEYELLDTTFPVMDYQGFDMLFQLQAKELIDLSMIPNKPCFVHSFLNVMWLVDFEIINDKISRIFVLGPTFTGENSYNILRQRMDERNLSIQTKAMVLKHLDSLPIISTNVLTNIATQFHYVLTGQLTDHDIVNFIPKLDGSDSFDQSNTDMAKIPKTTHYGIWASEQKFLKLFREGNPSYREALAKSSSLSDGVKHNPKDSLRRAKNSGIVFLTLLSRAAIEGGVSPNLAYDLCDYYTGRLENASTMNEHSVIMKEMQNAYFSQVCAAKEKSGVSKIISNCCDFIQLHITEKISIAELAENAGYSEYYFSRKFKQEMGCSITEYISKEKIEQAKELLCTTTMSILDISLELSFNSRSYFSDTFQKITGLSPGEYRKQNTKL